jgi:serine/threonine-protein kinase
MINVSESIGLEIGAGRYRILERIGEGSMGQIFRAYDHHLETDVVLKFPVAGEDTLQGADFLSRFEREIRALVRLSHPHIVKVIDVGNLEGHPYVVMQYLSGGSLQSRFESGHGSEPSPMAPSSLRDWLLDVARALDFIHEKNHIHRDVKPANILFDEHGNAFLGDFGVIKALARDDQAWRGNAATAPGFLLGTPNYVAPEIVMGRPFDRRVDQYALAMTVHELLTGTNCMSGGTPSATMVNQTMVVPPLLDELVPEIPPGVSDAIARALSKEPDDRFESCTALAHAVLSHLPVAGASAATMIGSGLHPTGGLRSAPCPVCRKPMPIGREHVGERVRCPNCQSVALVELSSNTLVLNSPRGPARWGGRSRYAVGLSLVALVLVAALIGWAFRGLRPEQAVAKPEVPPALAAVTARAQAVINVAYGTEKDKWLKEALALFEQTPEGRQVRVNLVGMGSVDGAQAILDGPGKTPFQVWSPASSAYRDVFEKEWRIKHGGDPILHSENLALTPMVFVLWKSRYEPFIAKYRTVSFRTIAAAMREPGGWASIGNQPEWGLFKFAHTEPSKSNSGLLTLVMMAYEFSRKERGLTTSDVTQPEFQQWLNDFEQGVARPGGSLTSSTGTLMKEMVLRGPSQYDCLMVYENLAIDYLDDARAHWGELQVVYPVENLWNEHPYYILNVPWSTSEQREAARHFLDFLLSEPIQRRALDHGFRPGNPSVAVRFPESPLVRYAPQGLAIDLARVCEPPRAEIVYDLIASFRRIAH